MITRVLYVTLFPKEGFQHRHEHVQGGASAVCYGGARVRNRAVTAVQHLQINTVRVFGVPITREDILQTLCCGLYVHQ